MRSFHFLRLLDPFGWLTDGLQSRLTVRIHFAPPTSPVSADSPPESAELQARWEDDWSEDPHRGPATVRGVDQPFFIWCLVWWPYALANRLNPFFTKSVFAPAGLNLTWNHSHPASEHSCLAAD
jgi:hypothetical protein